jgi:large subunit ribosomal protein L21
MYAIIADSGRQYRVEEGQEVVVDYRDLPHGEQVQFDRVLMISSEGGVQIGKPVVEGAVVTADVVGPIQGEKIYVQKFRRRKNSRRRTGHRQVHTTVKIAKIEIPAAASS